MVCAWLFTSFVVVYCCDQLYCFLDLGIFWAGGGDFAAEAGALFFCKRKNAQKAPLTGSGVFCAFNLYGDGLKKDGLSLCVRCEFTAVAHGVSILS